MKRFREVRLVEGVYWIEDQRRVLVFLQDCRGSREFKDQKDGSTAELMAAVIEWVYAAHPRLVIVQFTFYL